MASDREYYRGGPTRGIQSPWAAPLSAGTEVSVSRQGDDEKLNRALVAGLILEVVLDEPRLPEDPGERRSRVKNRLKDILVSRLAGHLPLSSFRSLTRCLDGWFECLYPLLSPEDAAAKAFSLPQETSSPAPCPLNEDLFAEFLQAIEPLLPKRRHRKLDRARLDAFLRRTRGHWFRLKDFEEYFAIDRKTAWEYVQKFLQAGLLTHNQGRAAAARYRLAARFLQN